MNFPATGGISDDAQFFFEDYNYYYSATQNRVPTREAPPGQRVTTEETRDVLLSSANGTGAGAQPEPSVNGQNGHDFEFSTLIANAMNQDGTGTQTGYDMGTGFDNQVLNGQTDHDGHPQRAQSVGSEEKRRSSKSSSNKVCRVCGDRALGYNFNVVTCESCKAFFRRNALKKKKLQCPFQNRCTITVSSRRYCQKCRLRKCFEVGMKAEYIMTEEQRAQKRQRLLERESMESNGGVPPTPGSVHCLDDGFFSNDNNERRRFDSMSSVRDVKPVLQSPKSSSSSSVTYQHDGPVNGLQMRSSSINSPIDVAAWVNDLPAQQPVTLASPLEPSALPNTFSTALETDDDMITIRIPKSALLGILFNNNDRTQQMTALGQAVVASAASSVASSSNSTVLIGGRTGKCTCPCTCGYAKAQEDQNKQMDPSSSAFAMDVEQMYGGLTAESQMAYGSMGDSFGLFPIQEEQGPLEPAVDTTQLSLSSLSMNDNTVCPTSTGTVTTYSAAPVQPSASMELDWDILSTITNAFEVDWQIPLPFPTLADFNSKYEKLDELLLANEEWNQYPRTVCPLKGSTAADISTEDFFNLIHYALRCVVKQHKRLSAFSSLSIQDQQALIKASIREMVVLRSVMKFDSASQHVQVQYPGREYVTLEMAKRIRGGIYNEYKQLIAYFPEKWRRNEAIMLIMSALVLFNPDSPHLTNKAAVESIRESYVQLLRDYLESTYGPAEAKQAYEYLLQCMRQLRPWVENYCIRVVFELEPNTMEPMLVEIFDFQ